MCSCHAWLLCSYINLTAVPESQMTDWACPTITAEDREIHEPSETLPIVMRERKGISTVLWRSIEMYSSYMI